GGARVPPVTWCRAGWVLLGVAPEGGGARGGTGRGGPREKRVRGRGLLSRLGGDWRCRRPGGRCGRRLPARASPRTRGLAPAPVADGKVPTDACAWEERARRPNDPPRSMPQRRRGVRPAPPLGRQEPRPPDAAAARTCELPRAAAHPRPRSMEWLPGAVPV